VLCNRSCRENYIVIYRRSLSLQKDTPTTPQHKYLVSDVRPVQTKEIMLPSRMLTEPNLSDRPDYIVCILKTANWVEEGEKNV